MVTSLQSGGFPCANSRKNLIRICSSVLKNFAVSEANLLADMLLYIDEVKYRKLHLKRGFKSIYAFLKTEYRYSKNQAYMRMCAAAALALDPAIEHAIRKNEICPTYLQSATIAIRRENKRRVFEKELKVDLAEQRELLRRIIANREAKRTIASFFPTLKPDYNEEKPITTELTQYTMAATKDDVAKITRIKELLSTKTDGNWHYIVMEMVEITLAKLDPANKPKRAPNLAPTIKQRKSRSVFVERALSHRADGRCEFSCKETGHRCEERRDLQVDHIIPVAHGGTDNYTNLRLLCRAHNLYEAWKLGLPVEKFIQ